MCPPIKAYTRLDRSASGNAKVPGPAAARTYAIA